MTSNSKHNKYKTQGTQKNEKLIFQKNRRLADLYKPVPNISMTTRKQYINYNFGAPLIMLLIKAVIKSCYEKKCV